MPQRPANKTESEDGLRLYDGSRIHELAECVVSDVGGSPDRALGLDPSNQDTLSLGLGPFKSSGPWLSGLWTLALCASAAGIIRVFGPCVVF